MDETVAAWRELVFACVENGDNLRDEAQVLMDCGRYPRALALAVLSFEEYGKAIHALSVVNAGGSAEERAAFERAYRAHQPKIEAGAIWTAIVDQAVPLDAELRQRLAAAARKAVGRKMDGFYVDRQSDGTVVRPGASVGRDDAQEYIDLAATLASHVGQVLSQLDTPEMFEVMWTYGPKASQMIAEIAAAHNATSEDQLRAMRGLLPKYGINPITRESRRGEGAGAE